VTRQAPRPGFYPERRDTPLPPVDRALAALRFRLQQRFARALADEPPATAGEAPLPELRYRLRRDGFRPEHVRACFAAYAAASGAAPSPPVLAAARRLVEGGVVELDEPAQREQALALAAFALALHGSAVHVLAPGETAAQRLAAALRPPLATLGMAVGCVRRGMDRTARTAAYASPVVCAALRELAQDYLRDAVSAGGARPGRFAAMLGGMGEGRAGQFMLRGLACALVDDADLALIDDAAAPVLIASDAEPPADRLMYEQAIELARGLAAGADFTLEGGEIHLTRAASELLERLVAPLGGAWALRERREPLVGLALAALHRLRRDVDYRVVDTRVVFPPPQEGEQSDAADEQLQRLVEVKEGLPFAARREVRARLSVPRFLRRYLHLSGIAADCRGLEEELWSLYSLQTARAGRPVAPPAWTARVFAAAADRRKAVVESVRAAVAAGREVLVAARSVEEAQALRELLAKAGAGEGAAALTVFSPAHGVPPRRTPGAAELVVAELLDSRRHVAWLQRAWGAERCTLHASIEDSGMAQGGGALAGVLGLAARENGELAETASRWALPALQRSVERANRDLRLDMASREQAMEDLLALSGQRN